MKKLVIMKPWWKGYKMKLKGWLEQSSASNFQLKGGWLQDCKMAEMHIKEEMGIKEEMDIKEEIDI